MHTYVYLHALLFLKVLVGPAVRLLAAESSCAPDALAAARMQTTAASGATTPPTRRQYSDNDCFSENHLKPAALPVTLVATET